MFCFFHEIFETHIASNVVRNKTFDEVEDITHYMSMKLYCLAAAKKKQCLKLAHSIPSVERRNKKNIK